MQSLALNKHRGQSTVEFALVAPLVVVCATVLIGVTVVCLQYIQLHDVARTAARLAVTADNPSQAAKDFAASKNVSAVVTDDLATGLVTVTLSRRSRIPVVGRISRIIGLTATSTMMRESPPVFSR